MILSVKSYSSKIDSKLPENIFTLDCETFEESALISALEEVKQKIGPIGGFIHLHFWDPSNQTNSLFPEIEINRLEQVFFAAKHLKASLEEASQKTRACFLTITRIDGQLGFSGDSDGGLVSTGLYGLTKTLSSEWENIFCRSLDISPDYSNSNVGNLIIDEWSDPDRRCLEVGISNRERMTLVMAEELKNSELIKFQDLGSNPLFLVSGGAKGVTAECLFELASQKKINFLLLGRSKVPSVEPEWAKGCKDNKELQKKAMQVLIDADEKPTPMGINRLLKQVASDREINLTLEQLKELGSTAEYISVDITHLADMKEKVAPVIQRLGQVKGIIHGAGVLADKLIEKKTGKDIRNVLATKIKGLECLLSLVTLDRLKYLISFTSAAGFFGNSGQSDYAAANEILNKTGQRIKKLHPSCHVVSLNWGPWDGGMVTPQLKKMFQERNIDVIPVQAGREIFVDQLDQKFSTVTEVVIGSSMVIAKQPHSPPWKANHKREISQTTNPFIKDHVIGGDAVLPIISALSWMSESCEENFPGYRISSCKEVQVFKGVSLTATQSIVLDLEINASQRSDNETIPCEVKIFSANKGGLPRFHYGGKIILKRNVEKRPVHKSIDLSEREGCEGAGLYKNGTLFHGKSYQQIKKVLNVSPTKLTLQCRSEEIRVKNQGQFSIGSFNPFAEDVLLQAMLVWVRLTKEAGSLPLKIKEGEFFEKIPFNVDFYVTLEVSDANPHKLVADLISHDSEGNIYSRLMGAEVTISKQLNDKFKN